MKSRIETAVQRFGDGCNCAQSVFTTYAPRYGVGESDALVHGLGKHFASLHGSLLYRRLLGCDSNSDEGKMQFKKQKLRNTKCVGCVRDACRLLEEMLPARMAG
ncbi:MAG: hypothetical protein NTU62_11465 [Spirochaetes bacterium]|nr:hypothetical protein [Spirochaetota bacterium]